VYQISDSDSIVISGILDWVSERGKYIKKKNHREDNVRAYAAATRLHLPPATAARRRGGVLIRFSLKTRFLLILCAQEL